MCTVRSIRPNPLSFTSLYLEAVFGNVNLGIATGLSWEYEGSIYLITNWHVVSGLHPQTQQPIDPNGSTPDRLRVWFHLANNLGKWDSYEFPLFDNQGRPIWKEHGILRFNVDVVAIKLDISSQFRLFPINNILLDKFKTEISQDVFIVGFPRGITGAGKFPIWKRGSIASEPEVDLDNLPKLLIDSMTKEGMSGSPVIVQYVGFHGDPVNPSGSDWIGMGRKFLGIYSGRLLGQDEFEAHLGIVWKESVINEIISLGIRPD